MNNFFSQTVQNFVDFFKSLDMTRRIGLIAVAGLLLASMTGIVVWSSKTDYKVLYTDLTKDDSAVIARMLEEGKINYQVADDGKTIKVPEDQVEIWRLEIAKKGVNFTGTVGYEVFDKQAFGTTSFVQKINKQRALEGELVKTIMHIKGVTRARIHLSIPEHSPFVSERKPPSASVVLDVERGVTMTGDEIKGIQSLVSSSVDGMRSHNVVVIDSRGKKLSENDGDNMSTETANRIALETKLNSQYEKKVEEILSRVIGEGKVIAKVAIKMDFTEKVETQTTYDSENAAVVSEVRNEQKMVGVRPSPQGIPGARSNLPGEAPQPGIPETRNDVDKSLVTRNMAVPTIVTKSKKPTAEISNMSVAVMVDGKKVPVMAKDGTPMVNEDGIPVTKYQAWTEEELQNFQAIVGSALGINQTRGDKLVIKNMEFAKEDLSEMEAIMRARENRELMKNITKYLMIGAIISLFFFMVVRPFIQWLTENSVESIEDFLPKTIEELEKIQANQRLPGLEDVLPSIEDKLNPEKIEGNMLREKIISLVEQNPGKAAQVVHEMIHAADTNKEIA
ncbi:flagellar basal-body MS-ring/collar protein FliF [Peredibacter starrii]|uniref:Flagellar M-ring protein n=1 Tax=Peredibacter starrii TaxID=28202 RepID=A0AAX4HP19_9BACT|nr:flagellar basal-body MS-ring/collar protein FliF [Peredibacter starrii]WPU64920.1 flagellar basal-body MS-ring/collar protein FliF [Peredibacter starrii]